MTLTETLLEEPRCRPARRPTPARVSISGRAARDIITPIPEGFRLQSGERLGQSRIVGRLHGRAGAPLVIVAGGISAGRFVHRTETNGLGWWSGAVSVRGAIDLDRFQVLSIDFAPEPEAGSEPVTITTHDQARLLALVLDQTGVETAAAFVGCSYGGMVALAFAELFPRRVEQLVVVSAAHRAHPQATAWRGIQRRILQFAVAAGRPEEGVALARQLAMTTYRTAEEFDGRFDGLAPAQAGGAYPVCDYLTARGEAYRTHTTPARWLSMSDSLDRHQITPEAIATPVTLVGFTSDRLVPIDDMRELAARLPTLWRFVEAPSLYGHDAFLKEDALVGDILRTALKDIAA
ncbi:homoserine O-succinyltransferase [Brevundimonas sp. PAMC22021]|uniref:homoserine O-succinyltransferase MetX n=1 Tax=Brevundimonas sp. PAMC22021 TaxID=2861285 RepID=UPI001C635EFC|nr:homoserine O-succinyltransferase [Brevundimonas sp. PAMC22021]QYF87088.1 homoserine O-succinyltransferase [Brevundimonas sp. PAMC22021]